MTTQNLRARIFSRADWASYYCLAEKLDQRVEEILMRACPFYKGKRVFETHFAFMGMPEINGYPLTVAKWLELHPADGQPKFYFNVDPWHVGQPHTDIAVLEPRLYIMLREIVPGSRNTTPEEHVKMLPPEYEQPTTIEEVTKNILAFRMTGKCSNPDDWAACTERTVKTSLVEAGDISCVGRFSEKIGLLVDCWNGQSNRHTGTGASLKF